MKQSFQWPIPIERMTEEQKREAAIWALGMIDSEIRYSNPMFEKGRVCLEAVEGKIFSQAELNEFKKYDIIPIQAPELKPKMDAIMGQLLNSGKSGKVIAAGTEDAAGAHIRTIILKAVSRENQLEYREAQVARDTFTTSVPGWIFIEAKDPNNPDEPGITLVQEDWDSVITDPDWKDRQLRDLRRATRVRRWGADEIVELVKDEKVRDLLLSRYENIGDSISTNYDERSRTISNIVNSRSEFDRTGKLSVFEMIHWVKAKVVTWYNPETGDTGAVPTAWNEQEIQQFLEMNSSYQVFTENRRTLWTTTITSSGLLLANGPHWLQSGRFPGYPCVPDRLNGKWAGLIEFVLDANKGGAYAETMWTHSIRTLTNNVWIALKGAIPDKDEFQTEIGKPNGLIELSEGFDKDSVKRLDNQREQRAYLEWYQASREQLGRLLVPENFVGGVQSSQEANSAIETRIDQTLSRLAPLVYGWHAFRLGLRRLIVSAMPYALTAHKIYRHMDPANGMQEAEINVPVEFDAWGETVATMNNLDGDEYDFIEAEDDDSKTGKQAADRELLAFFEASANMKPEQAEAAALASTSLSVQNYGRNLKKMREETPPPGPEVKNTVTLDANSLVANPLAQKAAVNLGIISEEDLESVREEAKEKTSGEEEDEGQEGESGLPVPMMEPMLPGGSGQGDPTMTEGLMYA